jgi:hypothetical protein
VNSTGVIEDSEILNSLNTGVTFWGCAQGATIRNSLVSGSAHQGVAIVADSVNNRISHNVQVVDNTLKNNAIANLLVDEFSDALVQGNTFDRGSRLQCTSARVARRQPDRRPSLQVPRRSRTERWRQRR